MLLSKKMYDVAVIGGGPAGMAAAIRARELGLDVILLESRGYLGGILPQCIHPGFGLHYLGEELTGPEFAYRLIKKVEAMEVEVHLSATVTGLEEGVLKKIRYISPGGISEISSRTIIYAGGARERHIYELGITGDRVAGIYTAGEAQALMDLYGVMPGRNVLIVGSGDVGLIMARRLALEGARVRGVVELMPYPGGLARNLAILSDFDIPLYLGYRVLEIRGHRRVEQVRIAKKNEGSVEDGFWVDVDTVIVSAGLVPYVRLLRRMGVKMDSATEGPVVNELWETSVPGVFCVGNSLLINDLVDYVVEQGERAAEGASEFLKNSLPVTWMSVRKGKNVRALVPHFISGERDALLYIRVSRPMEDAVLRIPQIGKEIRFSILKPAEMIRLEVKKDELVNAERPLTIEVVG